MFGWHDQRSPVVERRLRGRLADRRAVQFERLLPLKQRVRERAVTLGIHGGRRALLLRHAVHVEQASAHPDGVAGNGHTTLDENGVGVFRLVDLSGRHEDHHIAALWLRIPGQVDAAKRHVRPVRQLVDEQPVADQ